MLELHIEFLGFRNANRCCKQVYTRHVTQFTVTRNDAMHAYRLMVELGFMYAKVVGEQHGRSSRS